VSSTETVKKNPLKVQAMIAGLYRTMIYIHNPATRKEVNQYIARYHVSIWHSQKKLSLRRCNRTAKTAPNRGRLMEREIEIYRDTLKIAKPFTPDDLEDMSLLKKIHEEAATYGRSR